jgi:lauroyl/myristoyl acyltransferase
VPLIRRHIRPPQRPLIGWEDVALAFWLGAGVLLAHLPCRYRWQLCGMIARMTRTRRAANARACAMSIGRLSQADARRVINEVYTGRLAAHLDLLRSLLRGSDLRIVTHGLNGIDEALSRGRGVILWISDLVSATDMSKIALATAGYRIKHLSRIEHGFSKSLFGIKCLNPIRLKFESQFLEERVVFDRMNPAPVMARLIECLRANGIVSIVASAHEGGTLADVPFFSGRLRLALGALRLARLTGSQVIPVYALRDPSSPEVFDVTFGEALLAPKAVRGQDDLLDMARSYGSQLEAFVKQHPQSWVGWRRVGQLGP